MAGYSVVGVYWVMAPTDTPDPDPENSAGDALIKSVVVAAQILETLANAGGPMRLADLSRQLEMPRARVHRHLKTLRELGYVSQERNGERYWLGTRLFHLGQAAMDQFEITRIAERSMHALRDIFGQTVVLSTPVNGDAMIVATVESENIVKISVRPGTRLSAPTSAQGRIATAFAGRATREQLLESMEPADRTALEDRLALIHSRLFEFSSGEMLGGINVIAAPLLADGDELAGIIAVVGAAQDIAETAEAVDALRTQAAEISEILGSSAYRKLNVSGQPE